MKMTTEHPACSRLGHRARVREGYSSLSRTIPFVLRMRLRSHPDARGYLSVSYVSLREDRLSLEEDCGGIPSAPLLFAKCVMYALLPCAESQR